MNMVMGATVFNTDSEDLYVYDESKRIKNQYFIQMELGKT